MAAILDLSGQTFEGDTEIVFKKTASLVNPEGKVIKKQRLEAAAVSEVVHKQQELIARQNLDAQRHLDLIEASVNEAEKWQRRACDLNEIISILFGTLSDVNYAYEDVCKRIPDRLLAVMKEQDPSFTSDSDSES